MSVAPQQNPLISSQSTYFIEDKQHITILKLLPNPTFIIVYTDDISIFIHVAELQITEGIEDFFYFSVKTNVVTPYQNRLNETVLMMGHRIYFYGNIWIIIRKIIPVIPSYP